MVCPACILRDFHQSLENGADGFARSEDALPKKVTEFFCEATSFNPMQGQAADTQSPSPMLEAHWETVHHNSSILFFKQAVLTLQVAPL